MHTSYCDVIYLLVRLCNTGAPHYDSAGRARSRSLSMATLMVNDSPLAATIASCDEFFSSQVGIISNERCEESIRAMSTSVQLQTSHVDLDVDGATLVNNAIAGSMFSDVHKRALATAVSDRMTGAARA